MNPHYDEARRLSAEASLINEWGLTERSILATRAQAEATLAVVYELQQSRQPAPTTEPSHTGAAPVTSGEFQVGDWVRVVRRASDPLLGMVGRVRSDHGDLALVDFPDMKATPIHHAYLDRAPKPDDPTPRH